MKKILIALAFSCFASAASAQEDVGEAALDTTLVPEVDTRLFELRTCTAVEGKFDPLLARFRDHAVRLFAKHGMTNIGFWVPLENPQRQLIYLLAYPDQAAREASWRAFLTDPEWLAVVEQTEADGKLISAVDEQFLQPTAYSPAFNPSVSEEAPRLFEMRTYIAMPDLLPELHARFQQVTMNFFETHGMTNLGYFQLAPGQAGADQTLVYFLAHRDVPTATASWTAFNSNPAWIAAKQASEAAAGGSLTVVDGVKSLFLLPTDFSPTR